MRLYYLVLFLILFFDCSNNKEHTTATKNSITESVYASVTVQPDSLYQVHSIVSGILQENLVEEGDIVIKNQPLLQIINNSPKLNAQNNRLAADLAYQNYKGEATILNDIRNEIEAAKLKFKDDSINYFRQSNLWKQNIGSKAQYDTKKLNYELSKNSLKLLKDKFKRTENELKVLLKQAENNYETSLINTKDFTIKSKIDGKLYALYKEPGEIVNTQEPLASIGSRNNFIIEMLIDEVDIISITLGQKVLVTLDAYNNTVFDASITKIYPKKDVRNQTFLVEAIFTEVPERLYPGLSGEANIIIAKHDNVLTIPKSYLIDNDKVSTEDGLKTVELGLQSMEFAEIKSGISENTIIYKPE
ncbi:efflux RND transporter periplasmic adaptor subunit [Winogradskyella vincentii]|uniref:HlyD family efflux transporter periplasmic adaptor subunit n=1 Tax=Winogradskyella vincentii TaxID=2877122 RepID=A0ABS7Y2F0_9FLAO|nr:HlyD family efflux transporter periplasmic adaptor subunit [Winogradskyella vincentii]MCA0154111.1 HlyD family efflux transporter periplasmic adaptor subunit [Winogradskyella vincentii]